LKTSAVRKTALRDAQRKNQSDQNRWGIRSPVPLSAAWVLRLKTLTMVITALVVSSRKELSPSAKRLMPSGRGH
jgi:hypothetical protein